MKESLVAFLAQYPILTLFLAIGLGYVVGEIGLFGFRFGVAGVLFMGLAIGALDPAVSLPEVIPTLGLIIFVYTIGIQSGPALAQAFQRGGLRANMLAGGLLVFGALLTLGFSYLLSIPAPRAAGLFCGSLTSTPALAAARDAVREAAVARGVPREQARLEADQPVVSYSIAYPIGTIGVILCFQLFGRFWRNGSQPAEESPEILVRNFFVRNPGVAGRTLGAVLRLHRDCGFVVTRIQHEGEVDIATSDTRLEFGDIVAVVGDEEALERAELIFGEESPTHIEFDRSRFDHRRLYVSAKEVVGKRIRDLDLPNRLHAIITRLRRGDVDIVPTPDTRLEFGDQVRVLSPRERIPAVSAFFGNSIRGMAETDFGSVALGMVLGVFAGMAPIPLPGGNTVRLGFAGGPLLVALALGRLERTGGITWVIPTSANLTLRQIGLVLFLAGVGTRAGYDFVQTLRTDGPQLLAAGAAITFIVAIVSLLVGRRLLKLPYDALMGLVSGVHTQTASLSFAADHTRSDAPNIAYAGVYPLATIVKIVLAQLLATWPPV
ncbi:MAG TPA: aspartate:alanine exchanger family transporter [Bryobacteraceae bacterium]|nr:aspartate:alanine exchanger family transporter [Bryobacteraceae bacterium]HOQ45156.1 aspartate:alanine exchanger family transporter [Bryobacteraceae bacterium]HPU71228.1 aspartate:alanine exchanger family transporter [Bryobacteraceae bacterium]